MTGAFPSSTPSFGFFPSALFYLLYFIYVVCGWRPSFFLSIFPLFQKIWTDETVINTALHTHTGQQQKQQVHGAHRVDGERPADDEVKGGRIEADWRRRRRLDTETSASSTSSSLLSHYLFFSLYSPPYSYYYIQPISLSCWS